MHKITSIPYKLVEGQDAINGFRGISSPPTHALLFNTRGGLVMNGVGVALDAVFVLDNVIVDIQTMMPELPVSKTSDNPPKVEYRGKCEYNKVLEVPGRWCNFNGWHIGDKLHFDGEIASKIEDYMLLSKRGHRDETVLKLSAQTIESGEFWDWFDGSKVVDISGNPLVVYRGDSRCHRFTEGGFDVSKTSRGCYYFTESPEVAGQYSDTHGDELYKDEPTSYGIIPVYLRIVNLLDTTNVPYDFMDRLVAYFGYSPEELKDNNRAEAYTDLSFTWIYYLLKEIEKKGRYAFHTTYAWCGISRGIIEAIKSLGYDGIYDTEGDHGVWMVFDADQICSIYSFNKNLTKLSTIYNNTKKDLPDDVYAYLLGTCSARWGTDSVLESLGDLELQVVPLKDKYATTERDTSTLASVQTYADLSVHPAVYLCGSDRKVLLVLEGHEEDSPSIIAAIAMQIHRNACGMDWCPDINKETIYNILKLCGYSHHNIKICVDDMVRCICAFRLDEMLATMEALLYMTEYNKDPKGWLRQNIPERIWEHARYMCDFMLNMCSANSKALSKMGWPIPKILSGTLASNDVQVKSSLKLSVRDNTTTPRGLLWFTGQEPEFDWGAGGIRQERYNEIAENDWHNRVRQYNQGVWPEELPVGSIIITRGFLHYYLYVVWDYNGQYKQGLLCMYVPPIDDTITAKSAYDYYMMRIKELCDYTVDRPDEAQRIEFLRKYATCYGERGIFLANEEYMGLMRYGWDTYYEDTHTYYSEGLGETAKMVMQDRERVNKLIEEGGNDDFQIL